MSDLSSIKKGIKCSLAFLILFFGRYPLSRLISAQRKIQEPFKLKSEESYWFKSSSGNIVHVEFDGPEEAQVIVFIHGLNSSMQQWFYQRLYFRSKYRLVFIDLPGHGQSLPPRQFTIAAIARDLKEILDYFNVKNPVLYGHSIGGMIAMDFCLHHLENVVVKGIILQHTTCTKSLKTVLFSPILQALKKPFVIPFLNLVIEQRSFFKLARWITFFPGLNHLYIRYIFFTGKQSADQLRFVTLVAAKNPPEVVAKGLLETIIFDVRKELRKINAPTLVIGSLHDRLTKLTASTLIHKHIKNSELKIMNEGHLSMIENPSDVNKAVDDFLVKI